ncbi:hypothetical protein ABMY26_07275 (plasmid) [Azospirillum sp. HJ39]|uniref:hypothetical protein n=1 Tax=Azospirillum sp. HJ39 TaxID=3159496 RepID=UPI0035585A7A
MKIADLNLARVERDLTKHGMTPMAAAEAVALYRQFLDLVQQHPDLALCPPSAADLAWHAHMLRSAEYRADCIALFGAPIDHDGDAFGTPDFRAAWATTRQLWKERFGVDLVEDPDARDVNSHAPASCLRPLPRAA